MIYASVFQRVLINVQKKLQLCLERIARLLRTIPTSNKPDKTCGVVQDFISSCSIGEKVIKSTVRCSQKSYLSRKRLHLPYVDGLYVLGFLHFLHFRLCQSQASKGPAIQPGRTQFDFCYPRRHTFCLHTAGDGVRVLSPGIEDNRMRREKKCSCNQSINHLPQYFIFQWLFRQMRHCALSGMPGTCLEHSGLPSPVRRILSEPA